MKRKLLTILLLTFWLQTNAQCKLLDKWDKFDNSFSRQSEKITLIGAFLNSSTGEVEKNPNGSLQLLFFKKDSNNYLCCFYQKTNGPVATSDKNSKLSFITDNGKMVLSADQTSISKPEEFNTMELITLFPIELKQIEFFKNSKFTDCRFEYTEGTIEDSIKEKASLRLNKVSDCFVNTPIPPKK